uniref:FAS1 domain-containing protein n=1 Tax=Macrostomum lignano TaxID=282301 RepID=A0A1I8FA18_9PLAT
PSPATPENRSLPNKKPQKSESAASTPQPKHHPILFRLRSATNSLASGPDCCWQPPFVRWHQFTTQILVDAGMGLQMNTTGKLQRHPLLPGVRPQQHSLGRCVQGGQRWLQMPWTRPSWCSITTLPAAFLSDWASQGTPVGEDIGFGQVIILRPQEGTLYWAAKQTRSERGQSLQGAHHLSAASDAAWDRIPSAEMEKLNSLADEFRKVLVAATSPRTSPSSIKFSTGFNTVAWYNDSRMYLNSASKAFVSVGGVVAQFVDKSINYAARQRHHPRDLLSLAQTNAMPEFYRACSGVPSCLSLLSSNGTQLTLFAPADVTKPGQPQQTARSAGWSSLLMLHFVPGIVFKPSMKESDLLTAQGSSGQIRFRITMWRAACQNRGFVRAELTMFDQPAKNGIFHKVTRVLGQPVQTVKDFINSHEDLSRVRQFMGSNEFQPNLGDSQMAYTQCRHGGLLGYKNSKEVSIGAVILSDSQLRNRVFRRMVLPNQKIIADVAQPGSLSSPRRTQANEPRNEKITVNLKGSAGSLLDITGSFVMANISLAAGEYECTNGMVYPSSQVLFRDNDVEGYTRSGPAAASSSWTVLAVSLAALLTARWAGARH